MMVKILLAAGVVPYFILSYGNTLYDNACPAADKHDGTCPPSTAAGRQAFANFTVAAMAQWRGLGVLFEVWNEPNGGTWLPHATPPGQGYAELVLAVGAARDAAGLGDELLIGPAVGGVDLPFIETVAQAGCLQYLDGLSVHPYRPGGPESVLGSWDQLNALVDKYYVPASGSGSRRPRLVSGEWGWATCADGAGRAAACTSGGAVGQAVTLQEQAARLVRQRYVNDLAGVAHTIYYDWQNDGGGSLDSEDNFGTLAASANASFPVGAPKPAYTAALVSSTLLGNCSFDARLNSSLPGSFALAYSCPVGASPPPPQHQGQPRVLRHAVWDPSLWNATARPSEPATVLLPPSQAGGCFAVRDMYGEPAAGQQRVCAKGAGGRELAVVVRSEPLYLLQE